MIYIGVDLLKAVDQSKCQISKTALRRALFPFIGDMLKQDFKQLARQAEIERIANRKESMGICFIGKGHFYDFIENYIEPRPGKFVDLETGKIMGEHKGIHYWTRGQRAMIGGLAGAMFVVEKDTETNDIFLISIFI